MMHVHMHEGSRAGFLVLRHCLPVTLHGFPLTSGSASERCWGAVGGVRCSSFVILAGIEFISRGVRAQRPFCLSAIVAFYT